MLNAVFFDMDGVIVDTEKDGHLVAFNKTFQEFKLPVHWDAKLYHQLLQTGGGKERIGKYLQQIDFQSQEYLANPADFIGKLHKRKTEIFIALIDSGALPLRPGIKRLMQEINQRKIFLGICTTSNENSARAILRRLLADVQVDLLLAGDMVNKKKPDPEIYLMAMKKANITASQGWVIEDSRIGVTAAKNAGLNIVATVNFYTRDENVEAAEIVVDSLGEPHAPTAKLLHNKSPQGFKGFVDVDLLLTNMNTGGDQ